jgi:hypothetical protein
MPRIRPFAITVLLIAFAAAACGGGSADTTSSSVSDVMFSRGSVPETVPESFPIPEEAVVGATLVDPDRNVTEMILTFPADTAAVVDYYEQNLPPLGFTILSSDGSETVWRIVFSDSDADGEMGVQAAGSGIAAATVQFSER